MRSLQVYRALDQVSNRFKLCQTISQSVRLVHKSGDSMESSVTSALLGVGDRAFGSVVDAVPVALVHENSSAVMFYAAEAL